MTVQRVAIVSDYSLTTPGGAETAYFEQVRTLGEQLEVTAYSSACPRFSELDRFPGVSIEEVPILFRVPFLGLPVSRHDKRMHGFFVESFARRRIEVVHIHSEFAMGAAALSAARELGLPVVHTIHTFFWQTAWPIQRLLGWGTPIYHHLVTGLDATRERLAERPGDSALRNMTLTVARQVDAIVSPSAHQAHRLREAGLTNIAVIPNTMAAPIDAEPVTEVGHPLRVLWIGRFMSQKRVLPFLRSVRQAMDALPRGYLAVDLIGEGDQFAQAAKLVRGYPEISLHGHVPHSQVQRMVADSHVTALTSVGWDNQPMVVVESISALRGVIYCDPALTEGLVGPGIEAFGGEDSGEAALARVLVELAHDPSRVIAASQAAIAAREEFSIETYTRRTLALYDEVVSSRRTDG